ncbi:HK97 family phage prohead protease [Myroides sp. JBRI-B21084]|uniref:HK97 family phage prohead protease n=1 Tax=Myroides sp. JBRI-B21084 TaxID=3119977 RepID=UPI0026E3B4AC|nr:HK97 family phage prohead protease [Paenimyroides cloacae]WKW47268.1 HK97 family phage prohead protease [Paenimyroides cloacae]
MQMGKMILREAVIRAITDEMKENRQAEFVISTEAVDTYNTVFKIDGWDLTRYNRAPIVFYNHKSWSDDPDMIIGTSEVRIEGNQLVALLTLENNNPVADKVWRKIQNGTLTMASVGANPLEWRWGDFDKGENPDVIYFIRHELLEWSVVPVGSNPDALKRSVDSLEEIRTSLKKPENLEKKTSFSVIERQIKINQLKYSS